MKQFIKNTIIFVIPLCFVVLLVWIVDPLNYFGYNHIIPQARKDSIFAEYAGNDLIKIGEKKKVNFRQYKDVNGWIIGDSRTTPIETDYISSITNYSWYNMGIPGCYTRSAYSSFFWMINTATKKPNIVYWGHNFWGANSYNYFLEIEDHGTSPLKYITSHLIWKLIGMEINIPKETKNKIEDSEESWDELFNRKQNQISHEHIHVQAEIYDLIDSISHYCKRQNIRLIHVYPPEYKNLLAIIQSDSITNAEYQKYLDHLSQYEFYNFNQGHWIESSNDFVDPMHPKAHVYNNMIDSIFGD